MKILKLAWCFTALALCARVGLAQTEPPPPPPATTTTTTTTHVWEDPYGWWGGHFVYGPAMPAKYTPYEFSMDLFASYTHSERKFTHVFQDNIDEGIWGGGAGVSYYLTRNLGIMGDVNMPNDKGNLVNSVSGSLVLRFPFEAVGLSPYVFGGGGRGTDRVWEWLGHAGVGLEWRWNPVTGIFSDARYVWAEKTSDSLMIRAGLRFVF